MDLDSSSESAAGACLAGAFSEIVMRGGASLEEAEDLCIAVGHGLMAAAMASAPGRLDASPCSSLPGGVRVHDRGGGRWPPRWATWPPPMPAPLRPGDLLRFNKRRADVAR